MMLRKKGIYNQYNRLQMLNYEIILDSNYLNINK